jgi:NAD-dependent deacetylase
MSQLDEPVEALRALIDDAEKVVVFTGAGISTESGIPDFRSPGGVWERYRPVSYQDFLASADARRRYWQQKFDGHDAIVNARPNAGHLAVADLIQSGKATTVVTQNIDGLHVRAGVPAERVVELHGNTTYAHCLECATTYDLEPIRAAFEAKGTLPVCQSCGGMVKPATVSFGQSMPPEAMRRAEAAALDCDLFLAIGSSLVVYPAAAFPVLAKENGAKLAIINREATQMDSIADLVIHREIGTTLRAVVAIGL